MKIGSPAYVLKGFDVIVDCNVTGGTRPVTITWLRNGMPVDASEDSGADFTISNVTANETITCIVNNSIGSVERNTAIHVIGM